MTTSRIDLRAGSVSERLEVRISYEIIQLFSEGLYKSPHKAIEELVANSFDAGSQHVHVLMPRPGDADDWLWVVDDGSGMDRSGFTQLWEIAHSPKTDPNVSGPTGRAPIGQFGIGKLAAYVLAWRLTHISRAAGNYLFTSMNFRDVTDAHQWEEHTPIYLELRQIDEPTARAMLSDIEERDPAAWGLMFGASPSETWTAAALSDFKDLADRLQEGTLGWVLRTGLPRTTDFHISLNGEELESAKAEWEPIFTVQVGGDNDAEATNLGLAFDADGILIPGLGLVKGTASLFERSVAGGKSDQYGRSHGFFIRVRQRVVNLEDELFGLDVLNHAAWARFVMEVDADGLRDYLLSSREGVREAEPVRILRRYLHEKFNACRREFERARDEQLVGIDIRSLLIDAPSSLVTDPVLEAVRREVLAPGRQLYYIRTPEGLDTDAAQAWLQQFEEEAKTGLFTEVELEAHGRYARSAEYQANGRRLVINREHPFIVKMEAHSKNRTPATLFASSEILTDALVRQFGMDEATVAEFFESRERILRLLAGETPETAIDAIHLLDVASQDDTAMERAVGAAFRVLGFEYERRGGKSGGTDGVLSARLGRQGKDLADYRLVFDAKTTNSPRVPADKVDCTALIDFRRQESADFAFAIAKDFEGASDLQGALNRRARESGVSLLRSSDLRRLLDLHMRYGVTLTRIKTLFESAHSIPETAEWLDSLEAELTAPGAQVPLRVLLDAIEAQKRDALATPTVEVARSVPELKEFTPEKLRAVLAAAAEIVGRNWIQFDTSGPGVHLTQTPEQIVGEIQRVLSPAE